MGDRSLMNKLFATERYERGEEKSFVNTKNIVRMDGLLGNSIFQIKVLSIWKGFNL